MKISHYRFYNHALKRASVSVFILLVACLLIGCTEKKIPNTDKFENMLTEPEKLIVKNDLGNIVARIGIKNETIEGHCEWYDSNGEPIAYGYFKNGKPFSGTILNWSLFFKEIDPELQFNIDQYGKDWISVFESSFDSQLPNYEGLIESYQMGNKIETKK